MFNANANTEENEERRVPGEGAGAEDEEEGAEPGEEDGDEDEYEWGEEDRVPLWKRRNVQVGTGAVAAVVVVLLIVLFVVRSGGSDEAVAEETAALEEIEFNLEEVPVDVAVVVADVPALAESIAALTVDERVELLETLGVSEERAREVVEAGEAWGLNRWASDVPTDVRPWERYAMISGAMSGIGSEGSGSLGLVAQDVLGSLGPAVWPMVQADQTLRRVFTQSLVDWDYWGTQGELLVLDRYLEAASEASEEVKSRVAEEVSLTAQTRQYIEMVLGGLEPLQRGRNIAFEVNEAFADGRGWDTLDPAERSRLGRLAGQEIFEALSEFDGVMMRHGCSACGELYRNPPQGSPTSSAPGSNGAAVHGLG